MPDGVERSGVEHDPITDPYLQGGRLTDVVLFSIGVRDGSLRLDSPGGRWCAETATSIIETVTRRSR